MVDTLPPELQQDLDRIRRQISALQKQLIDVQCKVNLLHRGDRGPRTGYGETMHIVGEPNEGARSKRLVGGFGRMLTITVSKLRFSTLTVGACAFAAFCIVWFSCPPTDWHGTWFGVTVHYYYLLCTLLYCVWTIGIPAWFFLEFFYLYDFNYPEFDKFKHLQDLGKGYWLSVAIVLGAIFTVRTHLDFGAHMDGPPEKKNAMETISSAKEAAQAANEAAKTATQATKMLTETLSALRPTVTLPVKPAIPKPVDPFEDLQH